MADDVWDQIVRLAAEGKQPVIQIPKAAEVKIPKRSGPGRPPMYGDGAKATMLTENSHPMTCRNPGCRNRIRWRVAAITCGERCANELRDYAQVTVDVLLGKVPALEYPMRYRSRWTTNPEKHRKRGRPRKDEQ